MKKTERLINSVPCRKLVKFPLAMKLSIAAILMFSIQSFAVNSFAQNRITLNLRNVSLETVLKTIELQGEYNFVYKIEALPKQKNINILVRNEKLDIVMSAILKNTTLTYKEMRKNLIVIVDKSQSGGSVVSRILNGTVVNEKGEPVIGASVSLKGTTKGTSTNNDGKFAIEVDSEADSIIVSFINYQTQVLAVANRRDITVVLMPDSKNQQMAEVIVVGYEARKKEEVVGAVTTIKPEELRIPSSDLATALAGRAAGVIAFQRSGEPGADNVNFFVRGVTTLGYKSGPLILIDGIESSQTDLSRLVVDDIASFSILKDATSTAVYGARGANGVILVNTKKGKVGKAKIMFRVENSTSAPTHNVELADPITYMKMANEAVLTRDPIGRLPYLEDKINRTGTPGASPYIYPANDWKKILTKDFVNNQKYHLNVSGGGGVAKYFISGSLAQDNGLLKVDKINNFNNNIDLKSYSLRSNIDIDLTSSTVISVQLYGLFDDYSGPLRDGDDMYNLIMHSNPVQFPAVFPKDSAHQFVNHVMFGNQINPFSGGLYENPYAEMVKGYRQWNRSKMMATLQLNQNLNKWVKGLKIRGLINIDRMARTGINRFYNPFFYRISSYDPFTQDYTYYVMNSTSSRNPIGTVGTEYLGYNSEGTSAISFLHGEAAVNYDNRFGDHYLSGMVVSNIQQRVNSANSTFQLSLPFRNAGVSGRLSYGYDNRYNFDFNFGYNGSERFYKDQKFGFFPSAGVAWSIHNEKFFANARDVMNIFRIKYTYGLIGNDAIGRDQDRFFYLSEVFMDAGSRGAQFGRGDAGNTRWLSGVLVNRYANEDITWETSLQQNLGFELGFFKNLKINADLFNQMRNNILLQRVNIPSTMGLYQPGWANVGKASSKGFEVQLAYDKTLAGGAWLSGLGNFTYATNKILVNEEPQYKEAYRYRVGHNINQVFGLIAERLFVDDKEAQNSPNQNSVNAVMGGDIKYQDMNGDGQITNADVVPIGYPSVPEIIYGFGLSGGFKGVDLSFFFQGLANESFWINYAGISPFVNEAQVLKVIANDYWSEKNQNTQAFWPRLSNFVHSNNNRTSTWFMRDGSFLRLKQIELGYTIPRRITEKFKSSGLRVYFSGTNLLTFSKFKLWDPEMAGNGLGYPIQKVFNVGLSLNFN